MAQKILWDETTKRFYETGVDRGVLYPLNTSLGTYPIGYAWNGLISLTESPSGAEATPFYADNIKYLNMISVEEFAATLEAYTYPPEFGLCDGSAAPLLGVAFGQQGHAMFGLAYRTLLGNDTAGNDLGYKLHLLYGLNAAPSEKAYTTINDSPEAMTFSWELTSTPVAVTSYKPVSSIVIDSTLANSAKLLALEVILYGVAPSTNGRMPLPAEIITLMTP